MNAPPPLGVYIHWPYCARICPYCDFNVHRDRGRREEQAEVAAAIIRDLQAQAALTGPRPLASIYLGGGTPSLMDPDWAGRVIEAARRLWTSEPELEITLEANPTDAETARFAAFADAGVNRASIGVQALDDRVLRFLGRNHDAASARRAVELGRVVFPRVSLDLIYALSGQSIGDWRRGLDAALQLGPEHISAYQLGIEPGTAFERAARRGQLARIDPDAAAALYDFTQAHLETAGFDGYEISNHARGDAARSRHNLVYWRGEDYAAAGPGAHGRLTLGGERHGFATAPRPADYIAQVARTGQGFEALERLDARETALERLLLGLRTVEGAPLDALAPLPLDADALQRHRAGRLLSVRNGRLRATRRGRLVLDRLCAELAA